MFSHSHKHAVPIILVTSVVVASLVLLPTIGKDALSDRGARVSDMTLLKVLPEVIKKADSLYYQEIDRKKMYEGAIKGALAALDDPYTFYLPPRVQKREKENLYHAKFGGLGIRIYADKGFIKIARPLPNTPAMKSGLQAGDYIIRVNSEAINIGGPTGQTLEDVVDILRGHVGTQVTITLQRRGVAEPFDLTLTREEIRIDSVEKEMLDGHIGYIHINSFTGRTGSEFRNAIEQLQEVGMEALILDLRDNAGGLLEQANYVADAFISEGLIVSTKGRRRSFNQTYTARRDLLCPSGLPLVVMLNEYSASGSEIVAGAIKDHKRGVLLGTTSFGKGVVQQRFSLERSGGAVSLTISEYFTPSGASIDKKGITPHVVIDREKLEAEEVLIREKMRAGRYVNNFVEKWIEAEESRTGRTPEDFALLEEELSDLIEILKENGISLNVDLVTLEAHVIFNANVGIQQIVDLEHDNQLVEALRVLKDGEVDLILSKATTDSPIKDK